MNTNRFRKCLSVYLMAAAFSAYQAFGYSTGETKGDIDRTEQQIAMVRMFLDTLKLNVSAEEGVFPLKQYPVGGESFTLQQRHAVVTKQAGSITINGQALVTSHRVEIRLSEDSEAGSKNRLELLALLGVASDGNFIGSISVAAGNEDPALALFTLVYRFNSDGKVDFEGRDSTGWSFDKNSDEGGVVACHSADGSISTYNTESNQACVAPSLTSAQWSEIEQMYKSGASHEAIAAQYGLSCN